MRKSKPSNLFSKFYPAFDKNLESYESGIIGESLGGRSNSSFVSGQEEASDAIKELITADLMVRIGLLGKDGRPDKICIKNYLELMLAEWAGEFE